jgi:hypothetical protein
MVPKGSRATLPCSNCMGLGKKALKYVTVMSAIQKCACSSENLGSYLRIRAVTLSALWGLKEKWASLWWKGHPCLWWQGRAGNDTVPISYLVPTLVRGHYPTSSSSILVFECWGTSAHLPWRIPSLLLLTVEGMGKGQTLRNVIQGYCSLARLYRRASVCFFDKCTRSKTSIKRLQNGFEQWCPQWPDTQTSRGC